MSAPDSPMLSTFNFEVLIEPAAEGGVDGLARTASFAEVSGLETNLQIRQLREGGYNLGVRRLFEGADHGPLILRRGMTTDAAFWEWIQRCLHGPFPLPYVDGEVHVYDAGRREAPVIWRFKNGIVTSVSAAPLDASGGGGIPIEQLQIEHEALIREVAHE